MSEPLRLLLVDDHRMFRESIRSRLEEEPDLVVVAEASSPDEALEAMTQHAPDIVILDIRMPKGSGISLARELRARWPQVQILVLSGYDFDQYVRAMSRIGIRGYIVKDAPLDTLVDAIREIAKGGVVLPPGIAAKVMQGYASVESGPRNLWELTIRELDVLEQLVRGLSNAKIAAGLGISPRTVETHVRNILGKLGAKSRAVAVRIAVERGLIK